MKTQLDYIVQFGLLGSVNKIMIDNKIFWADDFDGEKAKGGIFVRAVDLKKFLELVEANENGNGGEVVGLRFDENNLEIIVKDLAS